MAAAGLALLLAAPAVEGASLKLTDREQKEALRVGQRSVTTDSFDAEWRVDNGAGEGVTVITPFHRLALAARNAAFGNQSLKPGHQARILRDLKERLVFWVSLRGSSEGFARHYRPQLLMGDVTIEPAFVQNERTAVRESDGRYRARCVYTFPSKDIPPKSRVTLVVRDADGRAVTRFAIDLARMR